MKRILLFWILVVPNILLFSQTKDSVLLNERTIDRPLTLHRGQLQLNTGYGISIIAANFNEKGNKTDLAELGNASLSHQYSFDFRYGIFNFLEFSMALNYIKTGVRKTNEIFISAYEPMIDISYLDNYKGFNDLYMGTGMSYPFFNKKIELFIEPGITLPVFSSEPDIPDHEYIPESTEQDYTKIYYINNYKNAEGALKFHLDAGFKLRTKKIGLTFLYKCAYPLNISESVNWNYRLVNDEFEYEDEPFEFLISDMTYFMIKPEYQVLPWFNVSIDFSSLSYKNGWSEETIIRLANPEKKLYKLTGGIEIKVTGKLWLTQLVSVPVAGENQVAPISFITSLCYNIFPFNK